MMSPWCPWYCRYTRQPHCALPAWELGTHIEAKIKWLTNYRKTFKIIFLYGDWCILFLSSWKCVPTSAINDNNPILIHIMAWCQRGNKSLSEPMMAQFIDVFVVKSTFEMLTVCRQQHSFLTHEQMFLWKCGRLETEDVLTCKGLDASTFRFMQNAWLLELSGPDSYCPMYLNTASGGTDIFSCDQAALWIVFSVRLSVCLSVWHTFLTMFPSSYHHEIFRSYH